MAVNKKFVAAAFAGSIAASMAFIEPMEGTKFRAYQDLSLIHI